MVVRGDELQVGDLIQACRTRASSVSWSWWGRHLSQRDRDRDFTVVRTQAGLTCRGEYGTKADFRMNPASMGGEGHRFEFKITRYAAEVNEYGEVSP